MRVNGDLEGIRKSTIAALDEINDYRLPQGVLWDAELVGQLAAITHELGREIAVYIDRKGRVTDVSVGDARTVDLMSIDGRRSSRRLAGVHCLHTHPNDSGMLSAPDVSSLKMLRLDAMIAVGVRDGEAKEIFVGVPSPGNPDEVDLLGPYEADKEDFDALNEYISDAEKQLMATAEPLAPDAERAILVGIKTRQTPDINGVSEAEISLDELEELAQTAGAVVLGRILQKRDAPDSATLLGRGKIEELRLLAQSLEADIIIFDEELSGAQQRNIEEVVGMKVLDRTGIILDIFASRARSREGMIQVELAQLEYRLPRLSGMSLGLSRLGGGIGTRGPGESKLESDRRHIRRRIDNLKEQLQSIRRQRSVLRNDRQKSRTPVVSIVGYTNAGKSTLLNTLCQADVLAEDKLFATLDTTTRKLLLSNGTPILLTDTVGFIRKLPHHLLDAFKSTLEEVVLADLLLVVADSTDPHAVDHVRIVDEILTELGASEKPMILVMNKADLIKTEAGRVTIRDDRHVVEISARTGLGLDKLKQELEKVLFSGRVSLELAIPFQEGALLSWLYANAKVLTTDYGPDATLITVEMDRDMMSRVAKYVIDPAETVAADTLEDLLAEEKIDLLEADE